MTDEEMQKIAKIIDNKVKDAIRPRDPETGHFAPKKKPLSPSEQFLLAIIGGFIGGGIIMFMMEAKWPMN